MAEFKVVGSSVPRAEGADKVIGRTLYAADVHLPGRSGERFCAVLIPMPALCTWIQGTPIEFRA